MRKSKWVSAAALAVLVALCGSRPAEARNGKTTLHSHEALSASAHAQPKRSSSKSKGFAPGKRGAGKQTAAKTATGKREVLEREAGKHEAARRSSPTVARAHRPAPAPVSSAAGRETRRKTFIRQNEHGQVVMERPGSLRPSGPSVLPIHEAVNFREPQNYPPAPCDPADAVLEARVHDVETGTPDSPSAEMREEAEAEAEAEAQAPVEPSATGARASLQRIARQLGSFFRPKSSDSEMRPQDVDLAGLVSKSFLIPVEGVDAARLQDSFLSSRRHHAKHLAIDIGAPRGTPIVATTDGEILRVVREKRGGKAIYQKDSTGQYLLFYCHLSKYAEGLSSGQKVRKGEVIGYVGSTGHVIGGPHLHFSITRVPENANFKKGLAINPYLLFLAGVP